MRVANATAPIMGPVHQGVPVGAPLPLYASGKYASGLRWPSSVYAKLGRRASITMYPTPAHNKF